jgi:hypothetical protein
MTNLTEVSAWDAGVYQFLTTDPVQGGPGGIDNQPHQNLADRTLWLRNRIAAAIIQSGQADSATDNQQLVEAIVLQVASIPALRLVPVPVVPSGQTVLVLTRGQNSDADGLAATYKWSATSTAADNGVAVVAPTGTPASGRWLVCGINASALGGQPASFYATSLAVAAAVALLAPLASAPLTGTPSAPTPPALDSSNRLATTQFVSNGFVSHVGTACVWNGNPNTYYKLATLPASSVTTADSIHIKATLNAGYVASADTMCDGIFGNRGGFAYVYNLFGPNNPATSIQCFAETDGTVSVYAVCTSTVGFATITILNAGTTGTAPILYPTPPATTTPTGSLIFSSAAPLIYPPYINVSSPLAYLTPTAAANTYLPIAGGTITGNLAIAGSNLRLSGGSSGVVYFNAASSAYLYYDGTNFSLQAPGGNLYLNGAEMATQAYANQAQANAIASANANTAAGYLPLSGGTLGGPLTITGNTLVYNGDLTVYRYGGTTGAIFLGSAGTHYLYFDGFNYNMPGGEVYANGYQLARVISPSLQGTPSAPTPPLTDNSGNIANTAFVQAVSQNILAAAEAYANGSSTQAATGRVVLPGGLIFQWGYIAAGNPGGEVANIVYNLPFANPHNTFFVIAIANGGSPVFVQSFTASQFTWGTGYTGGLAMTGIRVFAIGN